MTTDALPGAWVETTIDELLEQLENGRIVHHGWSPQCDAVPAQAQEWGVLKTTAIQAGRFEPQHNKRLPADKQPRHDLEVNTGDIVMTCAGPRARCGVPALVRATRARLILSGKMYRFRPDSRLMLDRYLEYFLLSPIAQEQIEGMKTGISDSGLNLTHGRFFKLVVPVPPIAEQKRIADEIERRLSHVDAAERSLRHAQKTLAGARVALIHATCTSELGSPPDRPDCPGSAIEARPALAPGSPTLPKDWSWYRLGDILREPLRNGRSAATADGADGVRTFTITAVTQRDFGRHNTKVAVGDAADFADLFVKDGDILIQRSNTPDLVGSAALYRGPHDVAVFPDLLIRIRVLESIEPEWVEMVLRWEHTRRFLRSIASGLSGSMPKIDQGKISQVLVPLPPPETRAAALHEYARRSSILDAGQHSIEQQLRRCVTLRRSILLAAFRGSLVPQDPDDEPAEAFLQRIRDERAAAAQSKTVKKNTTTTPRKPRAKKEPAA